MALDTITVDASAAAEAALALAALVTTPTNAEPQFTAAARTQFVTPGGIVSVRRNAESQHTGGRTPSVKRFIPKSSDGAAGGTNAPVKGVAPSSARFSVMEQYDTLNAASHKALQTTMHGRAGPSHLGTTRYGGVYAQHDPVEGID